MEKVRIHTDHKGPKRGHKKKGTKKGKKYVPGTQHFGQKQKKTHRVRPPKQSKHYRKSFLFDTATTRYQDKKTKNVFGVTSFWAACKKARKKHTKHTHNRGAGACSAYNLLDLHKSKKNLDGRCIGRHIHRMDLCADTV